MFPGRISLHSCCEIQAPLLLARRQAKAARRATGASSSSGNCSDCGNEEDNDDDWVGSVWSPLHPAREEPDLDKAAYTRRAAAVVVGDSDGEVDVWACPEVTSEIKRISARRRQALAVAERMNAMVQASREKRQQEKDEGRRKRKLSDQSAHADDGNTEASTIQAAPLSPELAKPQVLLIPELLPKGMLKASSKLSVEPAPMELSPTLHSQSSDQQSSGQQTAVASSRNASSAPLDLGLDLGFGFAQTQPRNTGQVQAGFQADTPSAILEITEFLERDIDVFSPSTATKLPQSATLPSRRTLAPPPPPAVSRSSAMELGAISTPRETRTQDLIEDILSMSF
ncbi:hypothetical protein GGF46_004859 [Coemansia sp. RSA 552]|nr:hypothetical protein GGF46_004859 [Coemansia sp. RSA 552]